MSFKKISLASITILSVFLFIIVVSAVTTLSVTFEFPNQKAVSVEGALSGGKVVGKATYNPTISDSELNMTLAKKNIIGYGTSIRCWDLATYRTTEVSCTFTSTAKKGTYKSSLILNSAKDSYPIRNGVYTVSN